MALTTQKNFTSDINGVYLKDIKDKLNYKHSVYSDRLKSVESALAYGDSFYQEYFDNYCNVGINANDSLLSDTNVVKSLENMATYLLMSDDVKEENKKLEQQYVSREEHLNKKMRRENEMSSDGTSKVENTLDNVMEKDNSNFKKLKTQVITVKDLERDDELGETLREYQAFLDSITDKLKDETKRKFKRYLYTANSGSVRDDMLICKDSMMKVHGYSLKHFGESTKPDYSHIDFTNERHLLGVKVEYKSGKKMAKGLLYFTPNDDYQDDFNCILVDLQNVIDKTNLTDFEKDVLELIRYNMSLVDIAKDLETYENKVKRTIKIVSKKVSKMSIELGYEYKGGIKSLK